MFTVAECIDDARDHHRSFTPRHTLDRSLLRRLNNYSRVLYFLTHKRQPDLFVTTENIAFPISPFEDGYDLTGLSSVMALPHGATINYIDAVSMQTLTLVPVRNRFSPGQGPAAYIENDTLKFVGLEKDWTPVASIDFKYIPEPTPAADETENVDLPDPARSPCVAELARFMAMRGPMNPNEQIDQQAFMQGKAVAEADYLDEIGRQRRATTHIVREVW